MTLRRTAAERAALQSAKATLDTLDFYPTPVNIDRVRVLHVPALFKLPWFRRFDGYEMGPLILLRHPIAHTSPSLIAHELCHVWQDQDHRLRLWWSYVATGYANNPHEHEARRAGAAAAA
ncbi:MAG TPA: hypothetical protein VNS09_04900 [Solirubrobacter sp.]|nr:hypothetical protein [Solirubrobacter sp.]